MTLWTNAKCQLIRTDCVGLQRWTAAHGWIDYEGSIDFSDWWEVDEVEAAKIRRSFTRGNPRVRSA